MTAGDKKVYDLIKEGQSGLYKAFIRGFTGRVRQVIELKNPLPAALVILDIDKLLDIINPDLLIEIHWLQNLQNALKEWHNEKIIANRLLGLKNDNEFDSTIFEAAVREKFFLNKNPTPSTIIQTDFKTMVELVEMGARRFSH